MLIINAETRNPSTEQQALGYLRDYSSNPGIAVAGLQIPDRHHRRTTEADVVVFTPFAAAVIAVKDIPERVGGTLSCPINGRWSMPGIEGDPAHPRGHDINPLHGVADPMSDLRNLATELEPGRELFVDGLVLVVPHPGTSVSLAKGALPPGRDVLLGGDASQLWKWLNRKAFRARTDPWTVELVIAVLAAAGVDQAHRPEEAATLRAALIREGFPAEPSETVPEAVAATVPQTPAVTEPDPPAPTKPDLPAAPSDAAEPDTPAAPAAEEAPTEPFDRPLTEHPAAAAPPPHDAARPLPFRKPAAAEPRVVVDFARREPEPDQEDWSTPAPSRRPARHRVEAVVVIGALATVLICFVWYFAGNRSQHTDAGNRPAPTSTAGTPPPAPIPAARILPAPAAPATAEVPAPQQDSGLFPQDARACYPFQLDC
ncbi:NERD domain-containing protein [Nocardia sp. NPDC052254]|uniref:NERD domain-containing protein n=1 Tax=Nocardia sp. NPDC052254 TaxID=3155681 RepID=UPI00343C0D9E